MAAGFNGPAGIVSEFAKLMSAQRRRDVGQALIERERQAEQFASIAGNSNYHRDIRSAAQQHLFNLSAHPFDKKLPKQYQPDNDHGGSSPAMSELLYRQQARQDTKRGEIAQPAQPQQPSEPAQPLSMPPGPANPPIMNNSPAINMADITAPVNAGAGGGAGMPGAGNPSMPPSPGGVRVGHNAITTGAAVPGIAPPPAPVVPASAASAGTFPAPGSAAEGTALANSIAGGGAGRVPTMMEPGEAAAYNNSIPSSSFSPGQLEALRIDPDNPPATINLAAQSKLAPLMKASADREVKWAQLQARYGIDRDGDPLPDDQVSAEVKYRRAMTVKADADTELAKARASGEPRRVAAAEANAAAASSKAASFARQVGVQAFAAGMDGGGAGGAGGAGDMTPADPVLGVLQDPKSYFTLPKGVQMRVQRALGRAPSKLTSEEEGRRNTAVYSMQLLKDVSDVVDKWDRRGIPITGPLRGRYNEAGNKFGDITLPYVPPQYQDEYQRDIAGLQDWLTALPIQEARALAGGRTAYQVINRVISSSPSLAKSRQTMNGSIQGLNRRFAGMIDYVDRRAWGGKPPGYKGHSGANTLATEGLGQPPGPNTTPSAGPTTAEEYLRRH